MNRWHRGVLGAGLCCLAIWGLWPASPPSTPIPVAPILAPPAVALAPNRAVVPPLPQLWVSLPTDPSNLRSADCTGWRSMAHAARQDRPPSAGDALVDAASRGRLPRPLWAAMRRTGLRPALLGQWLAIAEPRAALSALELDRRWYCMGCDRGETSDDPQDVALLELLLQSPDPVVADAASLARYRTPELADQLIAPGRSEHALLDGIQQHCGRDRSWSDTQHGVLTAAARHADDGELRVQAALALLRDAYNRDDGPALETGLQDYVKARDFCLDWGPHGFLEGDVRLNKDVSALDELDPPVGPVAMQRVVEELQKQFPALAFVGLDCGHYPCVASFGLSGWPWPSPALTLPPGVQVERFSLMAGGQRVAFVGVGSGWSAREARRVASWRTFPRFYCTYPSHLASVRVELAHRIDSEPEPTWQNAVRAAAFACHRDPATTLAEVVEVDGVRTATGWRFEASAQPSDSARREPEGRSGQAAMAAAEPMLDCIAGRAEPGDGPPRFALTSDLWPRAP